MKNIFYRDAGSPEENAGGAATETAETGTTTTETADAGTTTESAAAAPAENGESAPATETAAPAEASPATLKDKVKASFAKLNNGDQAANVISESGRIITELNAQTFALSATSNWIMADQVAEAVKAVEEATRETLDALN